jgi:hypothetical protein
MGENLLEYLKQVEDFRTKDGQRHQLWLVLLFIIMATMNGNLGNRACGDRDASILSKPAPTHRRQLPSQHYYY